MMTLEANILLVEDDQLNQLVATNLIQRWGMKVTVANNGVEALALIASKTFSLILMDVQMPVMDGLESTRRIRTMDDLYFKTVPIIAFTASGMLEIQEKVTASGMTDVITKPFVADEMRNTIRKHIPSLRKPLCIDFDLYTDGNAEAKSELLTLLISNMDELQESISITRVESQMVLKAFHKVKTSISILNDSELSQVVSEIESICRTNVTDLLQSKLEQLNKITERVKESLTLEGSELNQKLLLFNKPDYLIHPAA